MTTTTNTESARTSNARSRMATVRDLHIAYRFSGDDRADMANVALLAAHEVAVEARVAWDRANEVHTDAAQRNANGVVRATDITAGIVSSVACGLYGVTFEGHAFSVESTDGGSSSLRGVIYAGRTREVEGPEVLDIAHFFTTATAARDLARRIEAGLV